MKIIKLTCTTTATKVKPLPDGYGYLLPVNTAADGVACTINTRYEQPSLPNDILTLAHYPKTAVLLEIEHNQNFSKEIKGLKN